MVIYSLKKAKNVFFAGQMTGVEGYVESTSSGFTAGINAALLSLGKPLLSFSDITAIGALARYVSNENTVNFQPMNANFGVLEPLEKHVRDKAKRKEDLAKRALQIINEYKENANE